MPLSLWLTKKLSGKGVHLKIDKIPDIREHIHNCLVRVTICGHMRTVPNWKFYYVILSHFAAIAVDSNKNDFYGWRKNTRDRCSVSFWWKLTLLLCAECFIERRWTPFPGVISYYNYQTPIRSIFIMYSGLSYA